MLSAVEEYRANPAHSPELPAKISPLNAQMSRCESVFLPDVAPADFFAASIAGDAISRMFHRAFTGEFDFPPDYHHKRLNDIARLARCRQGLKGGGRVAGPAEVEESFSYGHVDESLLPRLNQPPELFSATMERVRERTDSLYHSSYQYKADPGRLFSEVGSIDPLRNIIPVLKAASEVSITPRGAVFFLPSDGWPDELAPDHLRSTKFAFLPDELQDRQREVRLNHQAMHNLLDTVIDRGVATGTRTDTEVNLARYLDSLRPEQTTVSEILKIHRSLEGLWKDVLTDLQHEMLASAAECVVPDHRPDTLRKVELLDAMEGRGERPVAGSSVGPASAYDQIVAVVHSLRDEGVRHGGEIGELLNYQARRSAIEFIVSFDSLVDAVRRGFDHSPQQGYLCLATAVLLNPWQYNLIEEIAGTRR